VLQKIKAMELTPAILTNGSVDVLASAVKSACIEEVLDYVFSVDLIRLFKTSPQSYGLVQQTIPVNIDEVLFVSRTTNQSHEVFHGFQFQAKPDRPVS
jgi:2-haloacid dehalogenase